MLITSIVVTYGKADPPSDRPFLISVITLKGNFHIFVESNETADNAQAKILEKGGQCVCVACFLK
jgi:hypothetical protein